jgi:hypothetical protein
MAALLCFFFAAACGDDGGDDATPTPLTPSPTARLSPTATRTPAATALPASDEPPDRDLPDLARRYLGLPAGAPLVARTKPLAHQPGDGETFTLLDLDGPTLYEINATVRAVSDHAYFFVQDGTSYSQSFLDRIVADFESVVWPAVTGAFGEPRSPGVDGDPRITVLHADLRGAGGYVSGADEFPRTIAPRSNEREMIYLDRSILGAPGLPYNDLAAHELQHLVHGALDGSEEAWVNEGLSQVASHLVGGGKEWLPAFLEQPDRQLNDWPVSGDSIPHYAAAELFFTYLLGQYGGTENAGALAGETADGLSGVEDYLEGYGVTLQDAFSDWTVANWLDAAEGPYAHLNLDATTGVSRSVDGPGDGSVHQFAADYLEVEAGAGDVFTFEGQTQVSVGVPERDGPYWWSNRGDAIDSRLTRTLDLSEVSTATLTFDVWHEIEEGWDYAYVAVSTDEGETWTPLAGEHMSEDDPAGQAYGPGYTGASDGWVSDSVDLTPYAGSEVLIRFEYVTDDSAHGTGFAVDNIAVAETGFMDGADSPAGWGVEGFRRIGGPLQQEWSLRLISSDGEVQPVSVNGGAAQVLLGQQAATIVIAAVTPGTTEPASYSWSLSP